MIPYGMQTPTAVWCLAQNTILLYLTIMHTNGRPMPIVNKCVTSDDAAAGDERLCRRRHAAVRGGGGRRAVM